MSLDQAGYAGTSHLVATKEMRRYNDWVYRLVSQGLPPKGELMEFGPGLGDFLERFHRDGIAVDAVENEREFHPTLKPISRRVVADLDELPGPYDGIFSVNVMEHLEDDEGFLRRFHAKLKPGGLLNLYAPAGPELYSHLDKLVHHFRRYGRGELEGKLRKAGFEVLSTERVDAAGYFVYGLYGLLKIGDGTISPWSMKLYDIVLYPITRVLDLIFLKSLGRSVFVRARKPG